MRTFLIFLTCAIIFALVLLYIGFQIGKSYTTESLVQEKSFVANNDSVSISTGSTALNIDGNNIDPSPAIFVEGLDNFYNIAKSIENLGDYESFLLSAGDFTNILDFLAIKYQDISLWEISFKFSAQTIIDSGANISDSELSEIKEALRSIIQGAIDGNPVEFTPENASILGAYALIFSSGDQQQIIEKLQTQTFFNIKLTETEIEHYTNLILIFRANTENDNCEKITSSNLQDFCRLFIAKA